MKILVFKIGAIGDVLLTTPALKKIKEYFQHCEIHYFVGKKAAEILKNNPFIDKIIIFEEKFPHLSKLFKIIAMRKWFKERFSNISYDYFLDFESSYYSTYISYCIKANKKIGFKIKDPRRYLLNYLYNKRLDYEQKDSYIVNKYLYMASTLGFNLIGKYEKPILKLTEKEIENGKNFYKQKNIKENDKKILLSISGTWKTKRWFTEHWIELINLINNKIQNSKIIILWGPGDEEIINNFKTLPVFIIPPLNLRELASIINSGDVLISNDNGVRHIANALNIKTIGIFGPTNEKGWAVEDDNNKIIVSDIKCRPCDKTKCNDILCMKEIKPEKVFDILLKLIK